jgi:hypothetical protein
MGPQGTDVKHDPEKAWPGLDPGWKPVFGKDHAPAMIWSRMTIRRKVILLWLVGTPPAVREWTI